MQSLQRTVSEISFHLTAATKPPPTSAADNHQATAKQQLQLPSIGESGAGAGAVEGEGEEAKCECCGMSEECTPAYVKKVREKFMGKMVCGLCAEAIGREMEKNGGKKEEAVAEHVKACVRFNGLGRAYPVLYQADAVKEMLRKKRQANSKGGGLARSSSCIPAIASRDLAAAGGKHSMHT